MPFLLFCLAAMFFGRRLSKWTYHDPQSQFLQVIESLYWRSISVVFLFWLFAEAPQLLHYFAF